MPVILKLKETYGIWQNHLAHFPKANRFTLGSKIDSIFLEAIQHCFLASYGQANEKRILLDKAIVRVDLLKLFLQLAWDIKALDNNKFASLFEPLSEIGKMLGGWKKGLQNKTPDTLFSREKRR